MMELEAGLFGVAPAGSESQLMPNSRQEQTPHSPPYPGALLFNTLHVFTMYRTAMGWPVRTKGIYKYVQNCTHRINEREGNRNYPNGDLTVHVSTV